MVNVTLMHISMYISVTANALFTSWGILHYRLNIKLFQDHSHMIDNDYYNYRNNFNKVKAILHWFIFFNTFILVDHGFFKHPK